MNDIYVLVHEHDHSNSLGFPKPAGPRPETLLAGYKRKRAIDQTFPSGFQCTEHCTQATLNVATMLLRPIMLRIMARLNLPDGVFAGEYQQCASRKYIELLWFCMFVV